MCALLLSLFWGEGYAAEDDAYPTVGGWVVRTVHDPFARGLSVAPPGVSIASRRCCRMGGSGGHTVSAHAESHQARAKAGPVRPLFLRDSITRGWMGVGRAVWDDSQESHAPASFGIGGDRTMGLIWRVEDGALVRRGRSRSIPDHSIRQSRRFPSVSP
jgi:hypothetical protein